MNINSNIIALNSFDPAAGSYLEVAVDEKGIEQLQVVQKNGFEVFIMWLGRLFGCCHNSSTSLKRIAELISNDIETICRSPRATPEGLNRFLEKIISYDRKHPNEISETVNKIAAAILSAPKIVARLDANSLVSLEAFDKALNNAENEKGQKNLIYQLSSDDFAKLLKDENYPASTLSKVMMAVKDPLCLKNFIIELCEPIRDLSSLISRGENVTSSTNDLSVEIQEYKRKSFAWQKVLNDIIAAQTPELQKDLIAHILANKSAEFITHCLEKNWIAFGRLNNAIFSLLKTHVTSVLDGKDGSNPHHYLTILEDATHRKCLLNNDFLNQLEPNQRRNYIAWIFHDQTIFSKRELTQFLVRLITSDTNKLIEIFPREVSIMSRDDFDFRENIFRTSAPISDVAIQIFACAGLSRPTAGLAPISPQLERSISLNNASKYAQEIATKVFLTILTHFNKPTFSLSPLSAIAVKPTRTLLELFTMDSILPKELIPTIMEFYGRGTDDEPVTPKCFNQLYVDIAVNELEILLPPLYPVIKAQNSGVHIELDESGSKASASSKEYDQKAAASAL